ncbi:MULTISPECIES: lytic polysaccharide monooxygenase [Burkholderia]|uniref:Chitin-binding protein n=1 Tax=Burkholderia pyrrocinia TaxID=60550 RepID=A0A318HT38_BURPY|nr:MULTISPECIES: lytic polysaccharide monooxygenase [Burkholderia]PXX21588.1 chitin-binding protein [Burkholderia pyrrocinia]SFW90359.1 chitin-binding protein [Burkholderia sp. NFACC33-1]SFY46455.1 chitin-binding protein [Burkholderia sp. NFPP32]
MRYLNFMTVRGRFARLRTGVKAGAHLLPLIGTMLMPLHEAAAHGAVGFPIARQYECRLSEDYWNGAGGIKHDDCRAAYVAAGNSPYPFQQWNEVSANPVGQGENVADLMKAVPDGLLCAGGDREKRGLDTATNWRKTRVVPRNGRIDVIWENTQYHNPARMRIYISKPSYVPARASLRWEDLQTIYDQDAPEPTPANGGGHLPGTIGTFYHLSVPIPPGRTGDAVIYSYWQRKDAGNEGFFNCSDVTIAPDEGSSGFPWVENGAYPGSEMQPAAYQQVRFRVMGGGARGAEVVDLHYPITTRNSDAKVWATELAIRLNSQYAEYVRIGVRSAGTISFDSKNIAANKVWLKAGYSSAMSIVGGN